MTSSQHVSLWMEQLAQSRVSRPRFEGQEKVDVVIIGAGFTGLWTAYYLISRAPGLKIAVLEAEQVGFGASGRNGGWLIGGLLGEDKLIGQQPAASQQQSWDLLHAIPDDVANILKLENIACDYRKGGALTCAARYPEQQTALEQHLAELLQMGHSTEDYQWLNAEQLRGHVHIAGATGAIFSPHCATIHPAKLVLGLADAVERCGVRIYENSRVLEWGRHQVTTASGALKAAWTVSALEGYSTSLPTLGRYQLPVQSLIIATEPLPDSTWAEIGLSQGQAFCENSRQVTYGQRTADNRMVFGARGSYRFGARTRAEFQLTDAELTLRRTLMISLFPVLNDAKITHSWGGNLGMSRRFRPHMLADRSAGVALAGGYGGEGVGTSYLGGRTLADLILERDSADTRQPWVYRDVPIAKALRAWEPEPFKWLGYSLISRSFAYEDRVLANPHSAGWHRQLAQRMATFSEQLMNL